MPPERELLSLQCHSRPPRAQRAEVRPLARVLRDQRHCSGRLPEQLPELLLSLGLLGLPASVFHDGLSAVVLPLPLRLLDLQQPRELPQLQLLSGPPPAPKLQVRASPGVLLDQHYSGRNLLRWVLLVYLQL